jgi:Fe-S cluster assembly protein SufB
MATTDLDLGRYQLGWSDAEDYIFKPKKGLNESIVREMSEMKNEPTWMRDFRLKALKHFERKPMASWFAAHMPDLDFNDIYYYIRSTTGKTCRTPSRTPTRSWGSPRPSASTSPG